MADRILMEEAPSRGLENKIQNKSSKTIQRILGISVFNYNGLRSIEWEEYGQNCCCPSWKSKKKSRSKTGEKDTGESVKSDSTQLAKENYSLDRTPSKRFSPYQKK